jgi:DNA-3-methyladenine glycosylase I
MAVYRSTATRCWGEGHPLLQPYHDTEWGVPLYDDGKLFEFLILEGMQAGLSWLIVLRKREHFRQAFDGFDPARVARYRARDVARLLRDPGIIRNRQKIEAAISNAQAFLAVQREQGSFHRFMWELIGGRPIVHAFRSLSRLPARTAESDAMSAALRGRGFRFVGTTICYAHMQATGMVNDHLVSCFRYREIQRLVRRPAGGRQGLAGPLVGGGPACYDGGLTPH